MAVTTPEPQLGLVCITASPEIRYRTITRSRLLTLRRRQRTTVLCELYRANVRMLERALRYCHRHGISLYRVSSGLFPFADDRMGQSIFESCVDALGEVGTLAQQYGIRIVNHPDQFVVLNSESPAVVANSIKMLTAQARTLDALEQPRSSWATIELHGGKSGRGRALVEVVRDLDDAIRTRLAFENDEYAFGAAEILEICQAAGVPMVFDAHHHLVHEQLSDYEHPSVAHYVRAAAATWPRPDWQLVHISNGRDALRDAKHSELIAVMPTAYRQVPYIEVEAKGKKRAIQGLRRRWLVQPRPQRPRPTRSRRS